MTATVRVDFDENKIVIEDDNNYFTDDLASDFGDFSINNEGTISGKYNFKTWNSPLAPPAPVATEFTPSLKHIPSKTFELKRKYRVLIAGVGGTGAYVARDLARFAYSLQAKSMDIDVEIHLFDPDVVEEKNLVRQNFILSDLGKPKAEGIAKRYGSAFGVNIVPHVCKLGKYQLDTYCGNSNWQDIIVGCID